MPRRWQTPSLNRQTRRWKRFKHQQKADQEVIALVHTAAQIDPLVYSLQLNPQITSQWEKLRTELHQIAQALAYRNLTWHHRRRAIPQPSAPLEPVSMLSVSSGHGNW